MRRSITVVGALCALAVCSMPFLSLAEDAPPANIQKQIDDNNAQIAQLDKEIAQYQAQLDTTTKQKNTLQNTINQLTLQSKQLTAKITVTKSQIQTTQLQIQQLAQGIAGKETKITTDERGLAESIRRLDQSDQRSLAVQVLGAESFADGWDDVYANETLQSAMKDRLDTLAAEKQSLSDTKTSTEAKKAQLLKQQNTLAAQQGSLTATKKAQSDLLAQTKNQEANYQTIIAQKKAQEASFESALENLKSQLNVTVNQSDITPAGKGVLHWPVDNVRITQYFGNTPFAATGAYNGKGHNGIDLGVPIGTPIKAALTGVVVGTGNTDLVRGCYSFGKWVMVKHANGLSTMYAHLSSIGVSQGQTVGTGQLLGYSGETGYATGPHLHFGVYVTAVTQILKLGDATKSVTPCAGAVMPVPPISGYLNPLNYL